jgi:hypothetical protein
MQKTKSKYNPYFFYVQKLNVYVYRIYFYEKVIIAGAR